MSALTDLIRIIPPDRDEEVEDIFSSAPGLIFTDDLHNYHGDPESVIVYKSRRFGEIKLQTADPNGETERQLFSHYLWNAGIKLAELISGPDEGAEKWSVRGERVLELGAGVGIDGIVATLAAAEEVVISDYPAEVVLNNIRQNAQRALSATLVGRCRVEGHQWGVFDTVFAQEAKHRFTRILAADCYWMPSQHLSLVQSMLHFLILGPEGEIFAVAGFHTGRAKLAAFFEVAVSEGLKIAEIYEEDANGVVRSWQSERDGGREDVTERKKWLVIARLQRANSDKTH